MLVRIAIGFLFLTVAAHGQENRASVAGQVTDSTGAAVPGAKIKVTSVEEKQKRKLDRGTCEGLGG